jgi:hypothetical protein
MALRVNMTGNATGFTQMLRTAKTQALAFSNSISSEVSGSWMNLGKSFASGIAGYLSASGVKSALQWFVDTGKNIKDAAEQVDMSAESWQKWADAADRAGLSGDGLDRVIESLRQKRTDALTDPKARGELNRLGFSDGDITGNMDMGDFLKRALANANQGDLQRSYLANIIGNRGLKYATALSQLPNAEALFSDQDLKDADQADKAQKAISKAVGKLVIGAVEDAAKTIEDEPKHPLGLTWSWRKMLFGGLGGLLWNPNPGSTATFQGGGGTFRGHGAGGGWGPTGGAGGVTTGTPAIDPMDAKLAEQRDQMAIQDQERKQRVLDSQRELMTIGDRRKSIQDEMKGLQQQLVARQAALKTTEGFLTDAQKNDLAGVTGKARAFAVNELREKYQDQTDDIQMRINRDRGELRHPPLSFQADSMAKVGLYSASALQFSPLLGIGQKTNQLLAQVVRNTAKPTAQPPSDPHRR